MRAGKPRKGVRGPHGAIMEKGVAPEREITFAEVCLGMGILAFLAGALMAVTRGGWAAVNMLLLAVTFLIFMVAADLWGMARAWRGKRERRDAT